MDWWALAARCNCTSYVRAFSFNARSQPVIVFWHGCITCKSRRFYTQTDACKEALMKIACATCILPLKAGKCTCFYAVSNSRRIHATAFNKARKLSLTSPAGCRLTYLQFEGEFTRGEIANCLQLRVFLPAVSGIFMFNCGYFCLQIACIFACKCRQFYIPVAGTFAWVPHVNLPAKYPRYSGKFTCGCRQFPCNLLEMLAT